MLEREMWRFIASPMLVSAGVFAHMVIAPPHASETQGEHEAPTLSPILGYALS